MSKGSNPAFVTSPSWVPWEGAVAITFNGQTVAWMCVDGDELANAAKIVLGVQRIDMDHLDLPAPDSPTACSAALVLCSFCGENQHAVAKMIAGPESDGRTAFICDECVEVCSKIVRESGGFPSADRRRETKMRDRFIGRLDRWSAARKATAG